MPVDLSALPPPPAVVKEDFEALRAAMIAEMRRLAPDWSPRTTDPAMRILEAGAYVRLLLGERINEAVEATWLATAQGADLDQVAAGLDAERKEGETDAAFRGRAQLQWAALGLGTRAGYEAAARRVAGVGGAHVTSPTPGAVSVAILGTAADGATPPGVVAAARAALTAADVKPITDAVTVSAAAVVSVDVTAALTLDGTGPDAAVVVAAATAAAAGVFAPRAIGRDVYRSAILAALHVPNVLNVVLSAPAADVSISDIQVALAGTITVTTA